jgi:ABC-type glycerol-3-phosphate transport system substrate-binding protein
MSRTFYRFSLAACLGLAVIAGSATAESENRKVKIINETNHTVVHFYGSNAGSTSWEEDILGEDVLKPGKSVTINFDDGSGYCKFDFLAKFDDGDKVEKHGIDVCKITTFRLTEGDD